MRLGEAESDKFYKLLWALYFYTNRRYPVIEGLKGPNLYDEEPEDVMKLNDILFSHPELIDSFVAENPMDLDRAGLETIRGWKGFVHGRFLIAAHLKKCTIFLTTDEEPMAYGVAGLYDEIEDIIPPFMPQFVETTLLPFNGIITYCGFINTYPVHMGGNMKRGVREEYQKAKRKFGLITSLEGPVEEKEGADEELLRYYIGSVKRRIEHEYEIEALLEKDPSLQNVYSLELGKSYARGVRKRLRHHGASQAWFAVFEDLIVASGKSKKEARERAEALLARGKWEGIHVFRHGKAGK